MLVESLHIMLIEINSYIRDLKIALQSFPLNSNENDYKIVINANRRPSAEHRGHHNEPTTNEVSVLLVNQDCDKQDIVLRRHDNRVQRISETHRLYDFLQYPLMFVYGHRSPENSRLRTTILSRANCIDIDNHWIVPFSPVLSRTFIAHINVEFCSSVKSIKYICKYVSKGSDLVVFGANDEVLTMKLYHIKMEDVLVLPKQSGAYYDFRFTKDSPQ
ncbi:ATP-dependent DNA helicase [Trichonephila clavipes]|nr:ATP-dependent DNA helicase [Trichonephila clavipes]